MIRVVRKDGVLTGGEVAAAYLSPHKYHKEVERALGRMTIVDTIIGG